MNGIYFMRNNNRHFFHWTQEGSLYIQLLFKREIIRGFRAIDQHIPIEELILLDAGCGTGQLTRELSEHIHTKNIYGCDINKEDIIGCQQKNPNICYFEHDLLYPFNDKPKFDVIFFTTALAQFTPEEQKFVLTNAFNQLTKNGFIWVVDVNNTATKNLFKQITDQYNVIYQNKFSKDLFNHYSVLKLTNKLPLTLVHLLDRLCIGSNVLTQIIFSPYS